MTLDTSSDAGADTRTSQTEDTQRGNAYSHHSQNIKRGQALVPTLETQEVSETRTAKPQTSQRRPRQKKRNSNVSKTNSKKGATTPSSSTRTADKKDCETTEKHNLTSDLNKKEIHTCLMTNIDKNILTLSNKYTSHRDTESQS